MGNLVGEVCKGPYINALDAELENVEQAHLDDLNGASSMYSLGTQRRLVTENDEDHVQNDWFGTGWWPELDPEEKRRVMRAGYIEATKQALAVPQGDPPKPIVSYWIKGFDKFGVQVSATKREVHVFWITPELPPSDTQSTNLVEENMVYIDDQAGIDAYRELLPNGAEIKDPQVILEPDGDQPAVLAQTVYSLGARGE